MVDQIHQLHIPSDTTCFFCQHACFLIFVADSDGPGLRPGTKGAQGPSPQAAQRRLRFSHKQPEAPATGAATSASIPRVDNQEEVMHWSDEHDPSWEQRVQEEANLYEELALADSFFMPDEFW